MSFPHIYFSNHEFIKLPFCARCPTLTNNVTTKVFLISCHFLWVDHYLFSDVFEKIKNEQEASLYGIRYDLYRNLISSRSVNDILRHGVEENYHIRVMVVGKENVGKSTLTSRLLQRPVKISQYNSTDGVDVHVHSCEVDIETGEWSEYNFCSSYRPA